MVLHLLRVVFYTISALLGTAHANSGNLERITEIKYLPTKYLLFYLTAQEVAIPRNLSFVCNKNSKLLIRKSNI